MRSGKEYDREKKRGEKRSEDNNRKRKGNRNIRSWMKGVKEESPTMR